MERNRFSSIFLVKKTINLFLVYHYFVLKHKKCSCGSTQNLLKNIITENIIAIGLLSLCN